FQRLRNTLREYFPAALNAYADLELTSTDALELLIKAPAPAAAAKLTWPQITAVLARHHRHNRSDDRPERADSRPGGAFSRASGR
ncbi:hypothetical protein VXC91_46745, partial [Streptomyces chiangmaiensis]|nr:hypothetical protein [Streptomyces chiangmaiensis]